jgi:phosphoglycolate phosphatase
MGTKTTYKLLIFDFDGTLVDTAPGIAAHANRVLGEFFQPERPLEEMKRAIGYGVHELMRRLTAGRHVSPKLIEKMVALFKERYAREPLLNTRVYPHVETMLTGPLRPFPKAIVTNKPQDLTVHILEQLSLREHFRSVIGGDGDFPQKPDPSSLIFTTLSLGSSPTKTLFIGDGAVDFETAKNAGVDFAWVDYGYDESLKNESSIRRFSNASDWQTLAAEPEAVL